MSHLSEDPHADARHQLAILARRTKARIVPRNRLRPCKWSPTSVLDPSIQQMFTEAGAWELVADKLEAGEELTCITLKKPPGRKAYVTKFRLETDQPEVYVKVELGSGTIFGRSFHYSNEAI